MQNVNGQEMKESHNNQQRNSNATGSAAAKKKKRPRNRIRHRNRNKSTTLNSEAVTATTTTIVVAEDGHPQTAPLQTQPVEVQSVLLNSQPQKLFNITPERNLTSPQKSDTTRKPNIVNNTNIKQAHKATTVPMKPPTPRKYAATVDSNTEQPTGTATGKTREQVMAEREAKKLAKQGKKPKAPGVTTASTVSANINAAVVEIVVPTENLSIKQFGNTSKNMNVSVENIADKLKSVTPSVATLTGESKPPIATEKTREQIKAEREAKKLAKQSAKSVKSATDVAAVTQQMAHLHLVERDGSALQVAASVSQLLQQLVPEEKKKPVLTKAERRAIQEAQRAVKSQAQTEKHVVSAKTVIPAKQVSNVEKYTTASVSKPNASSISGKALKINDCKVKLFNHLENARQDVGLFVNNAQIHPSIARLGEQYAKRTVVGSNARCIAFLNALKMVIQDFETPPKKEFSRSLEISIKHCVDHLQKCRPLAVSVTNAYKHMKHVLTQLPTDQPESELKESLCHFIETYIENQIGKAAQAISSSMQEKISNGDVILTFSCSSLINYICEEAHRRHVDFRVIVVDSRPFCEGQELLRRLTAKEIPCTYVLINAVGFVMPEVTKVLLGAHALLSNGYVMARAGTAQVALVARSFNVPVLVCCETHKFSERFQTDAIVYNELGNPDDLVLSDKCCLTNWQSKNKMSPLNLIYDITPPELVTAVVTEVSILPCTSVPVILRIKPTEIGYYS